LHTLCLNHRSLDEESVAGIDDVFMQPPSPEAECVLLVEPVCITESAAAKPDSAPNATDAATVASKAAEDAASRMAMLQVQQTLLNAHIMLHSYNAFGSRRTFTPAEYTAFGDPIQDAFGSLYAALVILRTVKMNGLGECSLSGELHLSTRLQIAAIVTVAHKMCTNLRNKETNIVVAAVQSLCFHWELPINTDGWERVVDRHQRIEGEVLLALPGISVLTESPVHYAEASIECFVASGRMAAAVGEILRGAAFFFVGACLLNPVEGVFEGIVGAYGAQTIGEAAAVLLASCFAASKHPTHMFKLPCSETHNRVALLLLHNGASAHAGKLRVGVYGEGGKRYKLLSRRVLHIVRPMFV
tara:strand:- start:99 stop:1172 length:1074 start_codon:yes stop_codon:yes gene_type:complete